MKEGETGLMEHSSSKNKATKTLGAEKYAFVLKMFICAMSVSVINKFTFVMFTMG